MPSRRLPVVTDCLDQLGLGVAAHPRQARVRSPANDRPPQPVRPAPAVPGVSRHSTRTLRLGSITVLKPDASYPATKHPVATAPVPAGSRVDPLRPWRTSAADRLRLWWLRSDPARGSNPARIEITIEGRLEHGECRLAKCSAPAPTTPPSPRHAAYSRSGRSRLFGGQQMRAAPQVNRLLGDRLGRLDDLLDRRLTEPTQ